VKVVKMKDKVVDQEKLMTAVTGRFYVVLKWTDGNGSHHFIFYFCQPF
jgi:hypothetical protein